MKGAFHQQCERHLLCQVCTTSASPRVLDTKLNEKLLQLLLLLLYFNCTVYNVFRHWNSENKRTDRFTKAPVQEEFSSSYSYSVTIHTRAVWKVRGLNLLLQSRSFVEVRWRSFTKYLPWQAI